MGAVAVDQTRSRCALSELAAQLEAFAIALGQP